MTGKNAETPSWQVWAGRCPGVCGVLGVGEAGGPQATLRETLFQRDKKDEVALGGQGGWSKAELGQPGGIGGGQRGPGGRGQAS